MDLLFACFNQSNKRKRWLEDVVERGRDTIDRETVAFNRDLQKILISKATHKKDIAADYNLFQFPAPGEKQDFRITTTSATAQNNDNEDPVVLSGWIHFACEHAAETTSNDAGAPSPKVVTCNAQGHTITGEGKDPDGLVFKISRGSWSPAGNYFWIEERVQTKQETFTFVLGNLFENNQSATVFQANGKKTRTYRTLELMGNDREMRCCCPSSQTAARITSEAAK